MKISPAVKNPYRRAKGWCHATPDVRIELTRQQASDYRRVASLGNAWGNKLDALGASMWMLRWVAGAAAPRHMLERELRYRSLVRLLEETAPGEDRRLAFRALMASRPKLGASGERAEKKRQLRERATAEARDASGKFTAEEKRE